MKENPLSLKTVKIRQAALALGFAGFGVARSCMDAAAEHLRQWLDRGFAGEMAYMQRGAEKRSCLDKVLPGVKSVICLQMNYFTVPKDMGFINHPDLGDISLYALNEDYHEVMAPKLKELEKIIQNEFPACKTKTYVDTGPVMEKPLAQNAGLGWIGKHTNLISEGRGSWFFLAAILVDVELAESEPSADRCGTCRQCIDICPTQAIIAPYVLDSRRCISYLTIELKGVIPLEFRKAIGNRIYGCDDCQIVCPWNSFAQTTDDPAFQGPVTTHKLADLMRLDEAAFNERFRHSPIKRLKRRGFLRNVAVALGNSGNQDAIAPLTEALRDKEPLVRAHAVWALGEVSGERALQAFQEMREADPLVLTEIQEKGGRMKDEG